MQFHSVTKVDEATDYRLGNVIGQAHFTVWHQNLLYFPVVCPINKKETADNDKYEC